MESQTTNRQDFVAHPVTPLTSKPSAVYTRPEGTIDDVSEYKKQYLRKWAPRTEMIRPPERKQENKGKSDYKSTQVADFISFPLPPKEFHGPKHVYEPPKELFDGKSTAKDDFVDFGKVDVTPSLKPPQKPMISSEPFDTISSYRTSFTPHMMPKRYQKPKEVYVPTEGEFNGISTAKSDFPPHLGVRPVESLRPPIKPVASDVPFKGDTESHLSYRRWELPPQHTRPPTVYTPPTEKFATQSTFRGDYPDYGRVEPAKSLKPPLRQHDQDKTFYSVTTQRNDFKAWTDAKRPDIIRQGQQYEPPTESLEAVSTFRAHYKGEFAPRTPSARPPRAPYTRSCKMESSTSYRDSYSQSGYRPCPALYLTESSKSPQAEYTFSHKDAETGHTFFSPLSKDTSSMSVVTA